MVSIVCTLLVCGTVLGTTYMVVQCVKDVRNPKHEELPEIEIDTKTDGPEEMTYGNVMAHLNEFYGG